MAYSILTGTNSVGSSGSTIAGQNTTGASLLVVSVSYYAGGGASPSVSDNKGNTWIGLTARVRTSIGQRLFYVASPTVGTGHSITVSGASIFAWWSFYAFTGGPAAPFEGQAGATTVAASPLATGALTPAANGALIISGWAGMNATSNPLVDSGLTKQFGNPIGSVSVAGAAAYLIQTTAAAINPTWSWTGTDPVAVAQAVFALTTAPTAITGTATPTLATVTLTTAVVLSPVGAGTVPEGPAPAVVDPQTGRALRLFVEIKARTPVTGGAPTPRTLLAAETSLRDPATWYGGMKPARLVSVSPSTRELSSELRAVECRIVVADIDRLFRTYGTWGPLTGAYCAVYVVSDDVRYAAGVPYRLFAGIIQSHRAQPGFQYEFVVQDVFSTRLARLDESPRIPPYRLTLADFPGMDEQLEGKAAQIVLGEASDEHVPLPDRGPQGVVPPQRLGVVNFATLWGGSAIDADAYIWSQSALPPHGVWNVYYNPPDTPDVRQVIPDASFGVDVWTPGKPGWAMTGLATDYIDYAGRRYTPFFVRRDHPLAQAAREGKVLIAGNLFGVSDAGDGSGLVLDSAARLWQWLIVNQLWVPYTTGDFADVPLLDATYGIIDTDSVEAAHAAHVARLAGGYVVGLLLGTDGKQETLRHVLGELCAGTDIEQGINRHGQAMLAVEDVEAPAVATFTDLHDIEDGQFETWVDAEAYVDRIEHQYGWRYVPPSAPSSTPAEGEPLPKSAIPKEQQEWTSGLVVREHAAARALHAEQPPRTRAVENRVVRSPIVAANLETTWLARAVGPEPMFEGPLAFRLTTGWQGLGVTTGVPIDLGSVIAITHTEGYGQHGYLTERGVVRKITVDPQRARVTLEGRLLTPTSPAGPPVTPPTGALARVQVATGTGTTTLTLTFVTPLTVGHGVLVGVVSNYGGATGFAAGTCTDNHGHVYSKALGKGGALGTESLTLYYCPITTATGASSVVTITPGVGAVSLLAAAIEVSGVGAGLALDQSSAVFGIGAIPAAFAATTTADAIVAVGLAVLSATQAAFPVSTTDVHAPAWLQEVEHLTGVAGEIDSRLLTDGTSSPVDVRWTGTASGWWVAGVAAFKAT